MKSHLSTKGLWRWALVLTMVIGAYFVGQSLAKSPALGKSAAGFDLPIAAGEGKGQRIRLSSYAGKVLVLDFWASWCDACRQSVPMLNRIQERFQQQDVTLLGVNTETISESELEAAHRLFGSRYATLQDRDGSLSHGYGVHVLPTIIVIGRQGKVDYASMGVPSQGELQRAIREAIKQFPLN